MDDEESKTREACRKGGEVERERCPTCDKDDEEYQYSNRCADPWHHNDNVRALQIGTTKTVRVAGSDISIPFWLHQLAFDAYAARGGKNRTAEQVARTGGFHISELDAFLPDWRVRKSP
jgi:hypothetical protein